MARKEVPFGYHDLLRSFKKAGCPVCNLQAEKDMVYLRSLLYESVCDPEVRQRLRLSRGFCHKHTVMLLEAGRQIYDSLGISIIYKDLVDMNREVIMDHDDSASEGFVDKLRRLAVPDGKVLARAIRQALTAERECVVCERSRESEALYLEILARHVTEEDFSSRYRESPGLCMPHFCNLLDIMEDREALAVWLSLQGEKLAALSEELGEFIRKHDYLHSGEGFKKERDSYLRAMNTLAGDKIGT